LIARPGHRQLGFRINSGASLHDQARGAVDHARKPGFQLGIRIEKIPTVPSAVIDARRDSDPERACVAVHELVRCHARSTRN